MCCAAVQGHQQGKKCIDGYFVGRGKFSAQPTGASRSPVLARMNAGGGGGGAAAQAAVDQQSLALLSLLRAVGPLLTGAQITQSSSPHLPGFLPRSAVEAQCASAFVAADVNKNGEIDWQELRFALQTGFSQWRELWTRNLAQQLLRAFDTDGSMELSWAEFCELYAFITQVSEEYVQMQRFDTPHDYTQRGRVTAYKVRGVWAGQLAAVPQHYIRVMMDSITPDCPNNSPEESREIPLSAYLRFRSEVFLAHKVFARLPKSEDDDQSAVLSREMLVSLFCA